MPQLVLMGHRGTVMASCQHHTVRQLISVATSPKISPQLPHFIFRNHHKSSPRGWSWWCFSVQPWAVTWFSPWCSGLVQWLWLCLIFLINHFNSYLMIDNLALIHISLMVIMLNIIKDCGGLANLYANKLTYHSFMNTWQKTWDFWSKKD